MENEFVQARSAYLGYVDKILSMDQAGHDAEAKELLHGAGKDAAEGMYACAERLIQAGFLVEHLRFGDVDNLWATHGGGDPVLVFLGHTDVVPTGPEGDWASAPFDPTIRDGRLYGRGAADMKSGVAAMVLALEAYARSNPDHRGTVGLLLTSDEEGPFNRDGVKRVVEEFRRRDQRIDWCVTGEPSSRARLGDIVRIGRRGSLSAHLRVRGVQGQTRSPARGKKKRGTASAAPRA